MEHHAYAFEAAEILRRLGARVASGGKHVTRSPIDGSPLAQIDLSGRDATQRAVGKASEAFLSWRQTPAPRRGELVRRFGDELRKHKADLAHLITLEVGKISTESLGEVQEMIDICDYAVGLSRQLYGRTIVSERADHALRELWHPLGVVAVITAFNFPGSSLGVERRARLRLRRQRRLEAIGKSTAHRACDCGTVRSRRARIRSSGEPASGHRRRSGSRRRACRRRTRGAGIGDRFDGNGS